MLKRGIVMTAGVLNRCPIENAFVIDIVTQQIYGITMYKIINIIHMGLLGCTGEEERGIGSTGRKIMERSVWREGREEEEEKKHPFN